MLGAWLGTFADAAHTAATSWTDGYHDEHGLRCCTVEHDCQPTPVRLLAQTAEGTIVEIAGTVITLHPKAVHLSETGDSWWCARRFTVPPTREVTRCVFVAAGW